MNALHNDTPGTCPLCGADIVNSSRARHLDEGVSYRLYDCSNCTVQFWWPLRNPGANWYEHDERYADRNLDPILKPNKKHTDVISFLKGKEGRVLDVGCGTGNFLAYAKQQGWEGWGIDFDRDAIIAGKTTLGLSNLEVADLGEFGNAHPDLRFDLVTFFDVFEHIDNHEEFLQQVRSLLTSHGRLALSVPYRHGWRWLLPHDLPPRHLTRWDEVSAANILARAGFTITKVWRHPASFRFLLMKFRFRYGAWASLGLVRKVRAREEGTGVNITRPPSVKARFVHFLARAKDIVLFGLPAGLLWLILLPTRKRYTDFYLVAEVIPLTGSSVS